MSKKKKRSYKKRITRQDPERLDEVYGIALIAGALIFIVCLAFTDLTGVFGRYLVLLFRYLVGAGVYLIPIIMIFWGLTFLFRKPAKNLELAGIGYLIAFISLISIFHAYFIGFSANKAFSNEAIQGYGGYIGAIFSVPIKFLFGTLSSYISYIIFGATFLIGLVIATNFSVSSTIVNLKEYFSKQRKETQNRREKQARDRKAKAKRLLREDADEDITETVEAESLETETLEIDHRVQPEVFDIGETKEIEPEQLKIKVPESSIKSGSYKLPSLNLLKKSRSKSALKRSTKESIEILESTLREFDVGATVAKVIDGPTVTRFELQLETGVKVNRIYNLADDIALALASPDVRIIAPIPGKSAVGIEVPNIYRQLVTLGDILNTKKAKKRWAILTVGLGKDVGGNPVLPNLGEMPHFLIAGATGSGKSICINSILISILMKATPEDVRLILIDPKRIELNLYNDLPHLLVPVVTNAKQAALALNWAVEEMEARFEALQENKVRNIDAYNRLINEEEKDEEEEKEKKKMPYIIIVIDELADLMMVAANDVEQAICRVAQMARAVGIHLVVATQRPSADVITGLIKSNITSRVAFAVSSQMDSRVILDTGGAEKLVGKGDLLFISADSLKPRRIQGSFITEKEIEMVTTYIKKQMVPEYQEDIIKSRDSKFGLLDYEEPLIDDAINLVVTTNQASISMLQRRLRVGYTRAARMIDIMEERGIVGPYEGSRPRDVLINLEELNESLEQQDKNNFDKI